MGDAARKLTPDDLRRELRRVLSRAESERIVSRLFTDADRVSIDERARRASDGVEVDDVAIARARKALRRGR